MPGDLVLIIFGSLPLAIAAVKAWLGMRTVDRLAREAGVQ